jgi:hypothetical protein
MFESNQSRPTISDEYFSDDHARLRAQFIRDQWDLVGSEQGGGGLDLKDLVRLAEVWGRFLVPLPLSASVIAHRHLPKRSVPPSALLSFAVPGPAGADYSLASHYGVEGVVFVSWGAEGPSFSESVSASAVDSFAPSLPIGIVPRGELVPAANGALGEFAVLLAAEAVGSAARAFELALDYTYQRRAFGRPIGEFQAVKHRIANMYRDLEIGRTAVLWAANESSRAPIAVGLALRLARRVVEGAIQIYGGMGFTWEAGIHFYLRHLLALDRLTKQSATSAEPSGMDR